MFLWTGLKRELRIEKKKQLVCPFDNQLKNSLENSLKKRHRFYLTANYVAILI